MIRTVAILSCLLGAVFGVHASVVNGPIQYNGHDYYLLSSQTWAQAEAEAVALGGHLVSINDQAEQDFLYSLAAANLNTGHWIGLTDQGIEGTWAWTSGDPVTYTDWSLPWEPNGGLTENCVVSEVAWGGKWNDLPCIRTHPAIVEYIPTPTATVLLNNLVSIVVGLNIQHGIENSLDAKLDTAIQALDDVNQNNDIAAINALQAFVNAVEAQRGHHISEAIADTLIADALEIIDVLNAGN